MSLEVGKIKKIPEETLGGVFKENLCLNVIFVGKLATYT